jgi:hypothetical protein
MRSFYSVMSFTGLALALGVVPAGAAAGTFANDLETQMDQVLLSNTLRGANEVQNSVASLSESSTRPCAGLQDDRSGSGSQSALAASDQTPFVGKGAFYLSRGGHAYAVFGGGRASEGGSLQNRALELEFGAYISPNVRVDVAHINEGHPINNHRDGFAAKAVYVLPINEKARVELGAGPYISMNTTTPKGRTLEYQKDEKRLGVVGTAALLYRLTEGGFYARAQVNQVKMPGGPSTTAVLVGLGKDFNRPQVSAELQMLESEKTQVSAWIGKSKTNRANAGGTITDGQIEASKEVSPSMAYSVSLVDEGKGPMVNRKGAAAQVWYVTPAGDNWKFRAGIGPYLAENNVRDDHRVSTNGMVSLVAERKITDKTSISARFNRVMSTNNRDGDMFMIGVEHDF